MIKKKKNITKKTRPDNVWTADYVRQELDWMVAHSKTMPNIIYMTQLCVERGYSPQTFAKRSNKFKDEVWFQEQHSFLKAILHVHLMEKGIADPKLTTMMIWMDKVNYGSHESSADNEKNVTIKIEQETL